MSMKFNGQTTGGYNNTQYFDTAALIDGSLWNQFDINGRRQYQQHKTGWDPYITATLSKHSAIFHDICSKLIESVGSGFLSRGKWGIMDWEEQTHVGSHRHPTWQLSLNCFDIGVSSTEHSARYSVPHPTSGGH